MLRVALGCGQRGRDYRHPERLLLGHRPIAVLQELVAASCAFRSSALLYRSPGPASGLLSGSQILPQDEAGAAVHAKDVAVCPPWPGMAAACCTGVRGGGRGAVLQGGPLPAAGSRGAPRQSQLQPRYSLLGQSPILTPPAPGSPAAAHCCSLCATWGGGEAGPEPRELRHHPPPGQGLLCPGPGPQPQQVPVYADHADHVDHCASLCASSPLGPHPSSSLRLMLFQHVLRCLKILFQVGVYLQPGEDPPTFVRTLGYHRAICPVSLPVPNLEGPGFSRASQRAPAGPGAERTLAALAPDTHGACSLPVHTERQRALPGCPGGEPGSTMDLQVSWARLSEHGRNTSGRSVWGSGALDPALTLTRLLLRWWLGFHLPRDLSR
ncbi:uncharacterized protein LOC125753492 isoform X1 [Canis lupus dingo]|uniref:uncharacterized protein LOC125753492 isoform X1 n=1 Tax=Canis lupus dingo TaxID=286419 RepID=UPI0020C3BA84|nr:uncharacterized protein LOC125753492 isoform X1 [Canis lupus dingo]